MLPVVSNLKTKLIAGAVAVAMLAGSVAPALAESKYDNGTPPPVWQYGKGHGGVGHQGGNGRQGGNDRRGGNDRNVTGQYYSGGNNNNSNANNNNVLLGAGLGVLLGYGLGTYNNSHRQPVYAQPVYPAPVYRPPVYQQPVYQPPVYQQPQQSVYNTPAAYAFQNYSWNERRRIQAALTNYGYYHGGLDGSFGPGTYDAISRYARNTGRTQFLGSQAGSAQIYDSLLG